MNGKKAIAALCLTLLTAGAHCAAWAADKAASS